MVPTVHSTTNKSDEVKEVIMGVKNIQPAGTDRLRKERFMYGGNAIKF